MSLKIPGAGRVGKMGRSSVSFSSCSVGVPVSSVLVKISKSWECLAIPDSILISYCKKACTAMPKYDGRHWLDRHAL